MTANPNFQKRFRNKVKTLPVVGSVSIRIYRYLKEPPEEGTEGEAGLATTLKKRLHRRAAQRRNILSFKPDYLSRKTVFHGYASLSSETVADKLTDALKDIATHFPIIVFPANRGNAIRIGFDETHCDEFTERLSNALGRKLHWDASPNSKTRRPSHLEMELDWGGQLRTRLRVSLYHKGDNRLGSRDTKNTVLRQIHRSALPKLERKALHFADDLLGGTPTAATPEDVDVVYTWVDHNDPEWQDLYAKANPNAGARTDAQSLARFTNRNELQYSLRSVERYMPWVRNIYVFTNCRCPDWITPSDRLIWVRHKDVLPAQALPTFNSHAIETGLHKIPGLAENFIYFNDDFFLNEAIPRAFFFSANNISNANLEDYGVVNGAVHAKDNDYLNAARNGAALIQEAFERLPTQLHKHAPYAMKRSILEEIEARFPDAINATRAAKFRSATDVSVASFLYHHYSYCSARGTQNGYRSKIIKNTMSDLDHQLKLLREGNGARSFCINDGEGSDTDEAWNKKIPAFLKARYPLPIKEEITAQKS